MRQGFILSAAFFNIAAAIFHIGFWRIFGWPKSLAGAGRINRSTIQVLNIVLIYVFLAYGGALLWLGSAAPGVLLVAGGGFYLLRVALQPLYYGLLHPASKALALLALFGVILHLLPVIFV